MKEVFQQYGGSVIAVMTGTILLCLIANLPFRTVAGDRQTEVCVVEGQAFEQYWRNQ